jgi:hypothetical protein
MAEVTIEFRGNIAHYTAEVRLVLPEEDGQTSHVFNLGKDSLIHPVHLKFSSLTGASVLVIGFERSADAEAVLILS